MDSIWLVNVLRYLSFEKNKQCRVMMLISDVSLNDTSVCMEVNLWVDQRLLVYETELY